MKICIFIPFPAWLIHTQVDLLIAKYCKDLNNDVEVIVCDRFYDKCPVLEQHPNLIAKEAACNSCKNISVQLEDWSRRMGISFKRLQLIGNDINPGDIDDRMDTSKSVSKILDIASLETTYTAMRTGGYGLCEQENLDYDISVYSQLKPFAYSLDNIIRRGSYDAAVCFNGRFSTANIFVALCAKFKVPCLIHEKGVEHGSYRFYVQEGGRVENQNDLNMSIREVAQKSPSTYTSLLKHSDEPNLMKRVLSGSKTSSHFSFRTQVSSEEFQNNLRFLVNASRQGRKLIGYFPSTFDESYSRSPLPIVQLRLLSELKRFALSRDEITIIIRLHPNFWLRRGVTSTDTVVTRYVEKLKAIGLPNLYIVGQYGISSVELIKYLHGAVVPNSSIAQDIRLLGYHHMPILMSTDSAYSSCASCSSSNLLAELTPFINSISCEQPPLGKTVHSNHERTVSYHARALALWAAFRSTSPCFDAIGSPADNPFVADMSRFRKLLELAPNSDEFFSDKDSKILEVIAHNLENHVTGYVSLVGHVLANPA